MKIFIDGAAGTTGLQLEERLSTRAGIELLRIAPGLRKDLDAKRELMEQADIIFLCLPDEEARIAAGLAPDNTIVIDASTAHRTAEGWVYGLPELSCAHRKKIADAKRIAVPGCHAAGFISAIFPLVTNGLLAHDAGLSCTSITGYSGGGKQLINIYETGREPGDILHAPRPYALGLNHKHLPEMKAVCGLEHAPIFLPLVGDMPQGMLVNIPLWLDASEVHAVLARHYGDPALHNNFIEVKPLAALPEGGFLDPTALKDTNKMELFVFGHSTQTLLTARLDNLGKGASGAAVQCMEIAAKMPTSPQK